MNKFLDKEYAIIFSSQSKETNNLLRYLRSIMPMNSKVPNYILSVYGGEVIIRTHEAEQEYFYGVGFKNEEQAMLFKLEFSA